jgi:16S rRNA (cytidine1402-2'-O)-methyltransferase
MSLGKLYLIPNFIGDQPSSFQFPDHNTAIITSIKHFFVENPKPARALIKTLNKEVNFDETELFQFDKHAKDNSPIYAEVFNCLKDGNDVGVISDAGCPGIADPGAELVKWAHEKNVEVIPLIGPSSIFLTLMSSGLNGQNFCFIGYLPKEGNEKTDQIKKLSKNIGQTKTTYLFIETPYKNESTFKDLLQNLNDSDRICLGIDLFAQHQQIITQTVAKWKSIKPLPVLKDRQVVFAIG